MGPQSDHFQPSYETASSAQRSEEEDPSPAEDSSLDQWPILPVPSDLRGHAGKGQREVAEGIYDACPGCGKEGYFISPFEGTGASKEREGRYIRWLQRNVSPTVPVDDKLLSAKEAGAILGMHPKQVVRLAEKGSLGALRFTRPAGPDGWRRFRRSDVLAYLASSNVQAEASSPDA